MPALSPPFTVLDLQKAIVGLLNADAYVQGVLKNAVGGQNEVLRDDPTPDTISQAEATRAVFALASQGRVDASLGGIQGGTTDTTSCFALTVYVYDGPNRNQASKDLVVSMTDILCAALMRYRQIQGTSAQGQLSWDTKFRNSGRDSTIYYTPKNCRLSVTLLDVTSRYPYT